MGGGRGAAAAGWTGEGRGEGRKMPAGGRMLRSHPGQGAAAPGGALRSGNDRMGEGSVGSRGAGWHRPARVASRRTVRTWGRFRPPPPPLARSATGRAACTAESGAPPCLHLNWQAPTRTGRRRLRLRPGLPGPALMHCARGRRAHAAGMPAGPSFRRAPAAIGPARAGAALATAGNNKNDQCAPRNMADRRGMDELEPGGGGP